MVHNVKFVEQKEEKEHLVFKTGTLKLSQTENTQEAALVFYCCLLPRQGNRIQENQSK